MNSSGSGAGGRSGPEAFEVLSDAFTTAMELGEADEGRFLRRFSREHPRLASELVELLAAASRASQFLSSPALDTEAVEDRAASTNRESMSIGRGSEVPE